MKHLVVCLVLISSLACAMSVFAQKPGRRARSAAPAEGIVHQLAPVGKTGLRFPRLTHFRDTSIMREVNAALDEMTAEFGCQDGEPGKTKYEVRAQVEYAARDIFSIYVSQSWFCGGAYPTNDYNNSVTFDMETGTIVEFEQLFRDYEKDKPEILGVMFGPQIAAAAKLAARLAAENKQPGDNCDSDPEIWSLDSLETDSFSFNFSTAGLRVQPVWPHAAEACATRVTVPYAQLRKFAAPGSLLLRVQE
ncbi:MAG: hypothetical protein ACKV2V_24755 [Blastocatellia bacterium]